MDIPSDLQLLEWIRGHYFGKYRGTVVDNSDSTGRGRLQVQVPSVLGGLAVWAMPCVPYAGNGVGFYSLPDSGTGVWVEFEAGDPSFPVWSGCFWADSELPDSNDAGIKIWKTSSLQVRLDDNADEALIQNSNNASITLDSDVTTEGGLAKHTVGNSGVVSELGAGKVEVTEASVSVNNGSLEVI